MSLLSLGMLHTTSQLLPPASITNTAPLAERGGSKLYVPVENPQARGAARATELPPVRDTDDSMQLDDSKYKVYIYNIDDELSSEDESEPDDGRLVFLQDIDKHLKANRIPPSVLANSEGELAGMQMVLYNDPKSLSVPEEKDSVRKAIIESRHRTREKQRQELNGELPTQPENTGNVSPEVMADDPVVAPIQQDLDAMDID